MSSSSRGPNDDDAATRTPTPGGDALRAGLDQTLVGVAPAPALNHPLLGAAAASPPSHEDASAEHASVEHASAPAASDRAITATPVIAVSGGASEQAVAAAAQPNEVSAPAGLARADAAPVLQRTALAADYLQAARDVALQKLAVPRPRRSTTPPPVGQVERAERASTEEGVRDLTRTITSASPAERSPNSMGAQTGRSGEPLAQASVPPAAAASTPREHAPSIEASAPSTAAAPAQPFARRFEPVPTVRAPLWEQAPPSVGRPLPVENAPPGWEPVAAAQAASGATSSRRRSRWHRLRWVAVVAAVLTAGALAVFGEQLARKPEGRVKLAESTTNIAVSEARPIAAAPEQTTLANQPTNDPAPATALASPPPPAAAPSPPVPASESTMVPVVAPASAELADDVEPRSSGALAPDKKKKPAKRAKARRRRPVKPKAESETAP